MDPRAFKLADLVVGQIERVEVDVHANDIDAFAELSGDISPIHTDLDIAREKGFEGRVVHGLLIGSYVSQLIGCRLPGIHGVMQSFEIGFRNPVIPPDCLTIEGEVSNISAGTGQVTIKVRVSNRDGLPVAMAKVRTVVKE